MSKPDLQAVLEPVGSDAESQPNRGDKSRVKGLSSWRGAKIGAIALPVWAASLVTLEILLNGVDPMDDSGEWSVLAAWVMTVGAVWGFIFGLFAGAIVGLAFDAFGKNAAVATGLIVPLTIAAALLEWRSHFDFWDWPGQHTFQFIAAVFATVVPLTTIVSRHIHQLEAHAAIKSSFNSSVNA